MKKIRSLCPVFRQVAIWQLLWEYSGIRRSLPGSREWKTRGSVPNGTILNYPVITSGEAGHEESFRNLLGDRYEELKDRMSPEFQVTEDTPRTFIWHTFEDQTVLLDNTLLFVQALYEKGIPVEI